MKRYLKLLLLSAWATVSCTQPIIDTFGNIGGVVSDGQSGIPLPGVQVLLTPTGYSQVTTSEGVFQFDNLDIQEYTLTFNKAGYETYHRKVSVKPGLSSSVQINLNVTETQKATILMKSASEVHDTWMRLTGVLTSTGNSQVTQHGFCYSTSSTPTLEDSFINLGTINMVGSFSALAENLSRNTTYHIRAFAQNGSGIAYSDEIIVTTSNSGSGTDEGIAVPGGLVAYYTFEKADISDNTDNELHGEMLNAPSFVSDTPSGSGKALFLNYSKNQYIRIPHNPFRGTDQYSICLWIKDFSTGMIFSASVEGEGLPRNDYPRLLFKSNGHFTYYTGYDNYDSTPYFDYDITSIQSGWHHIALTNTISGSQLTRRLYIDGKLSGATTTGTNANVSSAQVVLFGGNDGEKYSTGTSMKLDNIRFYTRTLKQDEISTIYAKESF